eukprot:750365-Hanusia_phi.AAC.1
MRTGNVGSSMGRGTGGEEREEEQGIESKEERREWRHVESERKGDVRVDLEALLTPRSSSLRLKALDLPPA